VQGLGHAGPAAGVLLDPPPAPSCSSRPQEAAAQLDQQQQEEQQQQQQEEEEEEVQVQGPPNGLPGSSPPAKPVQLRLLLWRPLTCRRRSCAAPPTRHVLTQHFTPCRRPGTPPHRPHPQQQEQEVEVEEVEVQEVVAAGAAPLEELLQANCWTDPAAMAALLLLQLLLAVVAVPSTGQASTSCWQAAGSPRCRCLW
jgi:hypothetical protein